MDNDDNATTETETHWTDESANPEYERFLFNAYEATVGTAR